jgi:predicted AAA+ superfamily ATPase
MQTAAGSPDFVPRTLDLRAAIEKKSLFLFGPRLTGKTSLVRRLLPGVRVFDLLDHRVFVELQQDPTRLSQELGPNERWAVIDEIQRVPDLLNEVHRLIETRGIHFLLTGSSPRKLRRAGVNLLGGRARVRRLVPLTTRELGGRFDLRRACDHGLLPALYFSDDPEADLAAYVGTYLQQEIIAEAAARNVPAFSRFLRVAAECNATIVNFTNVANDAQVPRTTVYEYFHILRDTLILDELPAWRVQARRKPIVSSKYYFFDIGVARHLQGRSWRPGTKEFGEAFETLLFHELSAWREYAPGAPPLAFWRSTSGFEVDFLLGDQAAVEAKAKAHVGIQDLRSLKALAEEAPRRHLVCACLEARPRHVEGIDVLPWQEFLSRLWAGEYL